MQLREAIEHVRTPEPVCPRCGAVQRDVWDFPDDATAQCQNCDAPIRIIRRRIETYTTHVLEG